MRAFIIALLFILVWVYVASGRDTSDNDKGFNTPATPVAPGCTRTPFERGCR